MVIKPSQWNAEVKDFLHVLCLDNEKFSEAQFHAKDSISGGGGGASGGSRKKAKTATIVVLSEEDQALAELGHSAQPQYSTVVPVEAEMFKFINYMKSIMLNENDIDTLPCLELSIAKANLGVTISLFYLELHLLFFLVLLHQEMLNELILRPAKFCPRLAKALNLPQ